MIAILAHLHLNVRSKNLCWRSRRCRRILGTFLTIFPAMALSSENKLVSNEAYIDLLIAKMTLEEKIGQMTQANKLSIDKNPGDITNWHLGSMLSGGGETPNPNNPATWVEMINHYQRHAMATRLQIPLLYGVDAVHGHGNVKGAVIFPHNIGLGASRDSELMREIGRVTAQEVAATGVHWNFAPAVSVPQDLRWGRTYEGYSENTKLVTSLSRAYLEGLQEASSGLTRPYVLGTAKHFVGDGGTTWGSSHHASYKIDQGDTPVDEQTLRRVHLAPYLAAVEAGVQTVMVSFSSWRGHYMHSHKYLITDVLKGELGFKGLVISDWLGVFAQGGRSYEDKVAHSVNAGIDMVMAVDQYKEFMITLRQLVWRNVVPIERINDAVRRILRVKLGAGLFSHPYTRVDYSGEFGSEAHRAVARAAVQKSAVLLKNADALPIQGKTVLVAGVAADDLGLQCGGWTLQWQGFRGKQTSGTTLLEGLRAAVPSDWQVHYQASLRGRSKPYQERADYGVVVLAEKPYAEGLGDDAKLELSHEDKQLIRSVRANSHKTILILYSGRPVIITEVLDQVDAVVAAWLPGTEGQGLADLLLGKVRFSGKLSFAWPRSLQHYHGNPLPAENTLFPYGFGL